MKEIVVSRAAQAEIDEIWVYHCEQSVAAADKIIDDIGDKFDTLAEFPNIGRRRPELQENCRSLPVGAYVLYYSVGAETVEILRVVHSSRRITTLSLLPDDEQDA